MIINTFKSRRAQKRAAKDARLDAEVRAHAEIILSLCSEWRRFLYLATLPRKVQEAVCVRLSAQQLRYGR